MFDKLHEGVLFGGAAVTVSSTDDLIAVYRNTLFLLASRFRRALLKSNPAKSSLVTLQEFPRGACGDASLLLAKYLQVNKCGESYYVLGERHGRWHAWLELQGFAIDITADQFEDQDLGVIVSRDSSWHSSFNGKFQNIADFCLYDRHTVYQLTAAYQDIIRHLDN